MQLLDGKIIAEKIKKVIAAEVAALIDLGERSPHLAAVLVGEDPASMTYVASKEKDCKEVGITSSIYKFDENTSEEKILEVVNFLNNDNEIDGFIVQLPLPGHISINKVISSILPSKDVDGFHPANFGKMVIGQDSYLPATPLGIIQLLKYSNIETEGKHCVVLGRSNIVGTPISIMLSRKSNPGNCTVTLCHTKTINLEDFSRSADILIVAMGQPEIIKAEMVKEGAVVIDVGMHRIEDNSIRGFHLVGDVKFNEVSRKCSFITPVPGGVGPMTRIGLLLNTMKAYRKEV